MKRIFEEPWFPAIQRPSRYLGTEINAVEKVREAVEVRMALAFPDVYDIGMSHLGLRILYHLLNALPWLAAERVFTPWPDMEEGLRTHGVPLTSLESGLPLAEFDILGFSMQHELAGTNVLTMLDLAGIPLLARDRTSAHPLVIAGGPACFNPEPFAGIFDALVIGDGEEAALEICRLMREAKRRPPGDRREFLETLTAIRGVYIPAFFRVQYREDDTIAAIEPLVSSYPRVEKALVPDLDQYPLPAAPVVPYTELVHDRLALEISRGCGRGCRFCQAGMLYRPVRERSPSTLLRAAEEALARTGYEEISLLSLSSGDYCAIEPLLGALVDRFTPQRVAVSLPSLRVDTLKPGLIAQIKRIRKTGFTLAPEAGSERLRRVINKGLTREEILAISRAVYEAGWNLLKLYFMIGLPTETPEDLEAILSLAQDISRACTRHRKRPNLHLGVSTFVPKAHTPFMWLPQISREESLRRQAFLRERLDHRHVTLKVNHPDLSWLEGIYSRGDRRLLAVTLDAWRRGARFDAWTEHFRRDLWEEALRNQGRNPDFYLLRPRAPDEILPWDPIHTGVSRTFLLDEWEKSRTGEFTPDCRKQCTGCGVCDHDTIRTRVHDAGPSQSIVPPGPPPPPVSFKYRLTMTKLGSCRFLGHLEWTRTLLRAFRRAGLPLVYSQGFHPMPKASFYGALPVGTESLAECVDITLAERIPQGLLKERITRELPKGIAVTWMEELSPKAPSVDPLETHYEISLHQPPPEPLDVAGFLGQESFFVTRVTAKGQVRVDARPLVKSLALTSPKSISLVLAHGGGTELRPADILRGIAGGIPLAIDRILKIKQVMRNGKESENAR